MAVLSSLFYTIVTIATYAILKVICTPHIHPRNVSVLYPYN